MRIFGEVSVLRGSAAWIRPRAPEPTTPPAAAVLPEFDEDGRLYVFRYPTAAPLAYRIDRDRIFDYMKRRRLPDEGQRQIRRDDRNRADFWEL